MIKEELYRAFWNRSLLLSLLLGFALLVYGLSDYCTFPDMPGAHQFDCNSYDAVIWAQKGIISLIVPLLAVLPFADSYLSDRLNGYVNSVLLRTTWRHYLSAKFLANLLAGGVAVALPILLLFAYTIGAYPRGILPIEQSRTVVGGIPDGPFASFYRPSPALYIFLLAGLAFIFGTVYATLGLAVSALTRSRYIVLATPFLLYHIANFVLAVLQLEEWTPPATFISDAAATANSYSVFSELGGIFLVSTVIVVLLARKERLYA